MIQADGGSIPGNSRHQIPQKAAMGLIYTSNSLGGDGVIGNPSSILRVSVGDGNHLVTISLLFILGH